MGTRDRVSYFYARDLWEHVSGECKTETVSDSFGLVHTWKRSRDLVLPVKIPRIEHHRKMLGSAVRVVQVSARSRSLSAERLHSTRTERDHRAKHLAVSYWERLVLLTISAIVENGDSIRRVRDREYTISSVLYYVMDSEKTLPLCYTGYK